MYYIGIDGGGTKTAFGLLDSEGTVIDTIELPTCHFLQVGYENCASIIKQGITSLLVKHQITNKDVHIGIGIAGYGNDVAVRQNLESHLHLAISDYTYKITNDVHVALLGALNGDDGIVIIAGTGSIVMAQCNGKIIRCGGWGYSLGDEGSAYWIGKQMLSTFCQQVDGRLEQSSLYPTIMEYFSLSHPYEIITIFSTLDNERTTIAKLATLCDTLAANGDIPCTRILERAGQELAILANALLVNFDSPPLVTYYGGVFKNSIVQQTLKSALHGKANIVKPIHDAVKGAYLFARTI